MAVQTSWLRVAILFSAGSVAAMQIGKAPGALPFMREDLGLCLVGAGWVVSIFSLIAAFAGVVMGTAVSRFNAMAGVVSGLLVSAAGAFAGAYAQSPAMLLSSRAVEGFGFIIAVVAIPRLIAASTSDEHRPKALGMWGGYNPTGTSAMLLIAAPLFMTIGWRGVWMLTGALVVAATLVVFFAARRIPAPAAPPGRSALGDLFGQPGPVLLAVVFCFYADMFLALFGFFPTLLIAHNGVSARAATMMTALAVAANIAGNFSSGFILARGVRARHSLSFAGITMGVTAALAFAVPMPVELRVLCGIVFAAVGGVIPGTLFALAPRFLHTPAGLSGINGLMMQGAAIGQLAGPPLAAFCVEIAGGWHGAIAPFAIATLIVVWGAFAISRIPRRDER